MKIINLVGARPQFIKAAMIGRELLSRQGVTVVILHTGQHFDRALSGDVLDELGFPEVDHHLGINQLSHGAMTGRMLEEIEKVLLIEKPDMVIVYGDTNSTLAGALAARKLHIKVAHVEAGMRSFNMHMPEEVNRVITDRVSDFLYCSSSLAVKHLMDEGYGRMQCHVVETGDVMYDAFLHFLPLSNSKSTILQQVRTKDFALCTIHRESNTDNPVVLASLMKALERINEDIAVVLPLHPRTRKQLERFGLSTKIQLLSPVTYLDMLQLLQHASIVLTDSGGLQKEAYFASKPCLTLRYETEWTELVERGYNKLVGTDPDWILNNFRWMMDNPPDFNKQLYGTGEASRTIAEHLTKTAVLATT